MVSLNPGQLARLNVFSLRINETQVGENHSDADEARPQRITIAFDIYARPAETGKPNTRRTATTPVRASFNLLLEDHAKWC